MSLVTANNNSTPPRPAWANLGDDGLADAAVALVGAYGDAQYELVRLVLPHVRHLLRIAEDAGVTPGHFAEPDLLIIWAAAVVNRDRRDRDDISILRLAKRSLIEDEMWDTGNPPFPPEDQSCFWNEGKLVALLTYPTSAGMVREAAKNLLALADRVESAVKARDAFSAAVIGDHPILKQKSLRVRTVRPHKVATMPALAIGGAA